LARNPKTEKLEILFLGIIDNLTNYTVSKQMATLFKSALWEADTLSTVPSDFYGDRFFQYLTCTLLGEGEEKIIVETTTTIETLTITKEPTRSLKIQTPENLSPRTSTDKTDNLKVKTRSVSPRGEVAVNSNTTITTTTTTTTTNITTTKYKKSRGNSEVSSPRGGEVNTNTQNEKQGLKPSEKDKKGDQ